LIGTQRQACYPHPRGQLHDAATLWLTRGSTGCDFRCFFSSDGDTPGRRRSRGALGSAADWLWRSGARSTLAIGLAALSSVRLSVVSPFGRRPLAVIAALLAPSGLNGAGHRVAANRQPAG
jgi:hypothetical protein